MPFAALTRSSWSGSGGWTSWNCGSRNARQHVRQAQQKMAAIAARLESLSPLGVFRRGYSLTQRAADGQIVRDASQLAVGEAIVTRLAAGRAVSRVESIEAQ